MQLYFSFVVANCFQVGQSKLALLHRLAGLFVDGIDDLLCRDTASRNPSATAAAADGGHAVNKCTRKHLLQLHIHMYGWLHA